MSQQTDPHEWKPFIQQGIAVVVVSSIFWIPLFAAIAAVFIDGIFGTRIIESFKALRP